MAAWTVEHTPQGSFSVRTDAWASYKLLINGGRGCSFHPIFQASFTIQSDAQRKMWVVQTDDPFRAYPVASIKDVLSKA